MKNAPVTTEHTLTAAGLLAMFRQVREATPEAAWVASTGGMAQALANLEARIGRQAWEKAYRQGRADAVKEEFDADSFWTENPYPDLDAP